MTPKERRPVGLLNQADEPVLVCRVAARRDFPADTASGHY
jgi:hypothetical protein